MRAYLALKKEKEMQTGEQTKQSGSNSVPVKIEQMVKQFKTHRCALDFDRGIHKLCHRDENRKRR